MSVSGETIHSDELESFLGTVPGMIYRSRLAPPFDVEFLSEETGTVAGYPTSDFVGSKPRRRWRDLIHPDDRERVLQTLLDAPANGSVTEVEYRVRRADGSQAWILSRARKLIGSDGTPWLHGAIYFTVAEALTNVAKYAQATDATVEVDVRDGAVVAEIADDGVCGASTASGSGLRGLADRLEALGGTLSIESVAGEGTFVRADVPIGR
jgi:hypothetical protein